MDYNPSRDGRSVQYQDFSSEPQWVDPSHMARVEERGQAYQMPPQAQQFSRPQQRQQPVRHSQNDPFIAEQLKARVEIAKLNCEFYEQLLASKNDCSIQLGKKIAIVDSLVKEHITLLHETKNNTERAEKVAKAVIHMLKQAEANSGTFPPALQQKAHLITQAVSHLRGLPATTAADQLKQKLRLHDQEIAKHSEQIANTTKIYQQKIHDRETAFVQLQQEQQAQKVQKPLRTSTPDPLLSPEVPQESKNSRGAHAKQEPMDELDELEEFGDDQPQQEADIWAVFEQEDQRRNIENEEKILEKETETTKKHEGKSDGVIFLTDEEAAAHDKARADQKHKKKKDMASFWEDLNAENDIPEDDDSDEDNSAPSDRSSGRSSSSKTTISISFGGKMGRSGSKTGRSKTTQSRKQQRPTSHLNASSILLNLKGGTMRKKAAALTPALPGDHPFPSVEHEGLRIVGKNFWFL